MNYKRNQIFEAIAGVFKATGEPVPAALETKLRRLLELDKELGCTPRSSDPERASFAFYSAAPQGTGVDTEFSGADGFAVMTSLRLLEHGFPQRSAVTIMRRVRPQLEKEHARILRQDPRKLFDAEVVRDRAQPGALAFGNTDPVILAIVSAGASSQERTAQRACAVCRGQEALAAFLNQHRSAPWTAMELSNGTHLFAQELAKTKPRMRGHKSR
ncbi:MAG: hypothetical protein AB7L90_16540 [Hyphomicrobiaceae bacterium]|uniref:hypothetical protein n=1 Tax=Pseudorhodoplanes sp. TaxID=1934341 RepID=UPI003D0CA041